MYRDIVGNLLSVLLHAAFLVWAVLEVGIPWTSGRAMGIFGQLLVEKVLGGHSRPFLGKDRADLASHIGE